MQNFNLNKIIADNLEKDKFQSKSSSRLPVNGWLNQYKSGGTTPKYKTGGGGPCPDGFEYSEEDDDCIPIGQSNNNQGFYNQGYNQGYNQIQNRRFNSSIGFSNPGYDFNYDFSLNPITKKNMSHSASLSFPNLFKVGHNSANFSLSGNYSPEREWRSNFNAGFPISRNPNKKDKITLTGGLGKNFMYNDPKSSPNYNAGVEYVGKMFGEKGPNVRINAEYSKFKMGGGIFPEYHSWAPPRMDEGGQPCAEGEMWSEELQKCVKVAATVKHGNETKYYHQPGSGGLNYQSVRTVSPYLSNRDIKKYTPVPTSGQDVDFISNYRNFKSYFDPGNVGDNFNPTSVPYEGEKHWNINRFIIDPHLGNAFGDLKASDSSSEEKRASILSDMYKYYMLQNPGHQGKAFRQAKRFVRKEVDPIMKGAFLNDLYTHNLEHTVPNFNLMDVLNTFDEQNPLISVNTFNRGMDQNESMRRLDGGKYHKEDWTPDKLKNISIDYLTNYKKMSKKDARKQWKTWEEDAVADQGNYNYEMSHPKPTRNKTIPKEWANLPEDALFYKVQDLPYDDEVGWNIEYSDPTTKKTNTKHFNTNEQAEQFYNDPANKSSKKYSDLIGHKYGGDISIPDLDAGNWLSKYKTGGGPGDEKITLTEAAEKGKHFNEQWMNSPMYKKMLAQSTGQPISIFLPNINEIDKQRKNELANTTWGIVNQEKEKNGELDTSAAWTQSYTPWYPVMAGNPTTIYEKFENHPTRYYKPYVGFVKQVAGKVGDDLSSDAAHEFSHSSDKGGILIPDKDLDLMKKYASSNYLKSPLFQKDKNTFSDFSNLSSNKDYIKAQEDWLKYVNDPTETRARLNDFRMRAKEQGLYDPFTQPFNIKYLNKYKQIDNSSWDPINQLRGSYSDEEISDMLNKISKSDNGQPQSTAKYGGWLKKYGPGGGVTTQTTKPPIKFGLTGSVKSNPMWKDGKLNPWAGMTGITGGSGAPSVTEKNDYVSMKNNKDWFDNHANWTDTGNEKWDNYVRQKVLTGKFGVDPKSGALIKLPENEWSNVSDEDKRLYTDYRQWTPEQKQTSWENQVKPYIQQSTKDLITNPVMMAPGVILTGGMAAGVPAIAETAAAVAPALETSIGGIPGLTAGNLLNAGFAYQGAKNLPNVASAWKDVANKPTWDKVGNALAETAFTSLDMAPFVGGAYKGLSSVIEDSKQIGNWLNKGYNTVATGESALPFAWKSPAVGLSQEASADMFKNVLNSGKLTDAERATILDYQHHSPTYTGRHGKFDEGKRQALNNIINKYNLNVGENAILTRRFNPDNGSLGATLENGTLNFGDRPTSFSAGVGVPKYGSGAVNRIVIPNRYAKKMGSNFLANQYSKLSDDVLKLMNEKSRNFGAGIGTTNTNINAEREVIGTGLDLKRIGKVKNDIGGYDWIVKPNSNSKYGSLSLNNQANEGAGSYGNWMVQGPQGPAVDLATNANNTIQKESINIIKDLTSPEGVNRLRNQFKIAMPKATEEQLDYMVGNRLREVNTSLVNNEPSFYLKYGKGAAGTPSYATEGAFFPEGNAHFENSFNPFPDVNQESAPFSLFNHNTPTNIGQPANLKDVGSFTNPDYRPGTITLGKGYEFNPHTVRHEAHGHGVQGSGTTNKLPLEHDLLELAKPKSIRDKIWFQIQKRKYPNFESEYKYFTKGNGTSREAYPYLVENRSLMKERGIINNTYDKVGINELLKNKQQADLHIKYGIPNSNDRFLRMFPSWKLPKVADIWNAAPAVVPALGAATVLMGAATVLNNKNETTNKFGGEISWLNKYK